LRMGDFSDNSAGIIAVIDEITSGRPH